MIFCIVNFADVNTRPDQHHHDVLTAVSAQAQTLQIFKTVAQRSRAPVLIHAILMVISWLALSSFGVIIARYYKSSEKVAEPVARNWFKVLTISKCAKIELSYIETFPILLISVAQVLHGVDFGVHGYRRGRDLLLLRGTDISWVSLETRTPGSHYDCLGFFPTTDCSIPPTTSL